MARLVFNLTLTLAICICDSSQARIKKNIRQQVVEINSNDDIKRLPKKLRGIKIFITKTIPMSKLDNEKFSNQLYKTFKDFLFKSHGQVVDLRVGIIRPIKYVGWADKFRIYNPNNITFSRYGGGIIGRIKGKVQQVLDDGLLMSKDYAHFFFVKNVDTTGLYDEVNLSLIVEPAGTKEYITVLGAKKTVPCYKLLPHVSKDEFKEYVRRKRFLVLYVPKELKTPPVKAKYKKLKCKRCNGKGKIDNHNRKKLLSKIKCTYCDGRGYFKQLVSEAKYGRTYKYWQILKVIFKK